MEGLNLNSSEPLSRVDFTLRRAIQRGIPKTREGAVELAVPREENPGRTDYQ